MHCKTDCFEATHEEVMGHRASCEIQIRENCQVARDAAKRDDLTYTGAAAAFHRHGQYSKMMAEV